MGRTDPGGVREEAERLVATALAAARSAVSGGHGARFTTGDAGCCSCPVCRAITVLREPSPEFAERLATGAGDLAAGVADLLRSFSTGQAPSAPEPQPATEWDVWAAATRTDVGQDDDSGGRGKGQR